MSSGENTKIPFKLVKIPVNNFKEVAVPHHLKLLEEHKNIVQKDKHDCTKMRNESISIKRAIAQLKDLHNELDTLRAQVEQTDLDQFDMKTVPLRKVILQIISEYTELLKQTTTLSSPAKQSPSENNETSELHQLQLSKSIDELKLEQSEACLQDVEQIQTDIQDLHSVYGSLHQMVVEQKEQVDQVEENVEIAQVNVTAGTRHIISAAKLKASIYPVTGAFVGTCIGGPLGLIAGLKVGGIAAVSCGVIGFIGGKVLKKRKLSQTDIEVIPPEINQENNETSKIKKEE